MRQAPVRFPLMFIGRTFGFPAEASGQCVSLTGSAFAGDGDRSRHAGDGLVGSAGAA